MRYEDILVRNELVTQEKESWQSRCVSMQQKLNAAVGEARSAQAELRVLKEI